MMHSAATPPPSLWRQASPGMQEPTGLIELPPEVKQQDPLLGARICKNFGSHWFHGRVVDMEADEKTGEFAYCVEYDDGDSEHLAERDVRAHLWRQSKGPIRRSFAPTPVTRSTFPSPMGSPAPAPQRAYASGTRSSSSTPPLVYILGGGVALLLASWLWDYRLSFFGGEAPSDLVDLASTHQTEDFASSLRFPVPQAAPAEQLNGIRPTSPQAAGFFRASHSDMASFPREVPKPPQFEQPKPFAASMPEMAKPPSFQKPVPFQPSMPTPSVESLLHSPPVPLHTPADTFGKPLAGSMQDFAGLNGVNSAGLGATEDPSGPSAGDDELDLLFVLVAFVLLLVGAACWLPKLVPLGNAVVDNGVLPLIQGSLANQDPYQSNVGGLQMTSTPQHAVNGAVPPTPQQTAGAPFHYPSPVPPAHVAAASPASAAKGNVTPPVAVATPTRASAPPPLGPKGIRKRQNHAETSAAASKSSKLVSPDSYKYGAAVVELCNMGFTDTADLREVVTFCRGSVPDAVNELFGR